VVWIFSRKCPESTPERKVRASVERLLAENPKGSVLIPVDQKSKNGLFGKVMDQAGLAAGAQEIAIAARDGAS
jgi:biopolymer transport protein ExbD